MKPHIVRVVLNADREGDRRILDYLRYAGKPMSKLFKLAMREFIERQDRADEENLNLTNIRRGDPRGAERPETLRREQFVFSADGRL